MTTAQRRVRAASFAIFLLAIGSANGAVMSLAALNATAEVEAAFPAASDAASNDAGTSGEVDPLSRVKAWTVAHRTFVFVGELGGALLLGILWAWSQRTPRAAILCALLLALTSTAMALAWSPSVFSMLARLVLLVLLVRGLIPEDAGESPGAAERGAVE